MSQAEGAHCGAADALAEEHRGACAARAVQFLTVWNRGLCACFSGPATRQRVVLVLAPVQLSRTSSSLGTFSHGSSLSSAAGIGPLLRRTLSPWAAGSKMCQ